MGFHWSPDADIEGEFIHLVSAFLTELLNPNLKFQKIGSTPLDVIHL